MSRISLSLTGMLRVALEREVDQRRGGGEALVPAGERVAHRALDDGRAHDGADDVRLGGDQLVAEALGVRVGVGPAPVARALDAELGQLARASTSCARARPRASARRRRGRGPLRRDACARCSRKRATCMRVVGLVAHALGDASRSRRSPARRENSTPGSSSLAREVADDGLVLPDRAGAVAGDEAGRDVDQRRALHPLGERDDVLRARRRWCAARSPAAG